jgi:hypothetical protein
MCKSVNLILRNSDGYKKQNTVLIQVNEENSAFHGGLEDSVNYTV